MSLAFVPSQQKQGTKGPPPNQATIQKASSKYLVRGIVYQTNILYLVSVMISGWQPVSDTSVFTCIVHAQTQIFLVEKFCASLQPTTFGTVDLSSTN